MRVTCWGPHVGDHTGCTGCHRRRGGPEPLGAAHTGPNTRVFANRTRLDRYCNAAVGNCAQIPSGATRAPGNTAAPHSLPGREAGSPGCLTRLNGITEARDG